MDVYILANFRTRHDAFLGYLSNWNSRTNLLPMRCHSNPGNTMRDAIGREVDLIPIAQTEGQAVYDTRRLTQGTYTIELMNSGRHIEAQKLVVQP